MPRDGQLALFDLPEEPAVPQGHGLRGCLGALVETGLPLDLVLALHAHYPGLSVHIPHRCPDHHPLVQSLGRHGADALTRVAPGCTLQIPIQPYLPDHLAARVRADLDAGHHVHTIARRYRISERQVWRIGGRP